MISEQRPQSQKYSTVARVLVALSRGMANSRPVRK